MRHVALTAAIAFGYSSLAAADQNQTEPYFGYSAGIVSTDSSRPTDSGIAGDATWGWPLTSKLAIEFSVGGSLYDMSVSSAEKATSYNAMTNAVWAFSDSAFSSNNASPFLNFGVGAEYEEFGGNSATTARIAAGGGVLLPLFGDHTRLKLSTEYVYIPSSDVYTLATTGEKEDYSDIHVAIGVQFDLGDRSDTRDCNQCDTDSDGVSDVADYCPGTIFNAPVDSRGCVGDADGDGVNDVDDRCFATAKGVTVDLWGCPPDADADGVPDQFDRCPSSANNVTVNTQGCFVDTDSDGVIDEADSCPTTAKSAAVDAKGCELDSDSDGVKNSADRCPTTPTGASVDVSGCQFDTDGDGVVDALDQCPNAGGSSNDTVGCPVVVAPVVAPSVDPTIVPVPAVILPVYIPEPVAAPSVADSDSDGVVDANDSCPYTDDGETVDASGCSVDALASDEIASQPADDVAAEESDSTAAIASSGIFIDSSIQFEPSSAALLSSAKPALDRIAEEMLAAKTIEYEIRGHTDGQGSTEFNQKLSDARAHAVRDYLKSKGISGWRVFAIGVGATDPLESNDTEEGRSANRRVEFRQRGGQ